MLALLVLGLFLGLAWHFARGRQLRAARILGPALWVGGVAFLVGFIGPMIVVPGANQGPMLGIFITGPLGFVVGLVYGVIRELRAAGE